MSQSIRRRPLSIACLFVAVAFPLVVADFSQGSENSNAPAADLIRWKFSVGDQYRIQIRQKSNIQTEVNRTKVAILLDLEFDMQWKLVELTDQGNAIFDQSFTRMSVKLIRSRKPIVVYDTSSGTEAADNAKPYAEVYDRLVGIQFRTEMTPRGEIVGVELSQEDQETVRRIPESMQARRLFEKRGLMEILNSNGFLLPEEEIEAGYKWPVQKSLKMTFGTADVESVFTYTGLKEGLAIFDVVSKAKLKDQPKNPAEKPLELKSQSQQGTIRFDAAAGHLSDINITQEMTTEKPFREMLIVTDSKLESKFVVEKIDEKVDE